MNEYAVAISHGGDDAGGHIVLHRENTGRLEVTIIGLGPKPASCLRVDELGAYANGGASLADASFQHITRTESGA